LLACSKCKFIFWNNPNPVTSVILEKKDRILLIKRNKRPLKDYRVLPGGVIDYNEKPEAAIIREVKEETNLDFRPTTIFRQGQYDDLYYHLFLGEHCGKIIPQQEEVAEGKWFTYEEANQLDLIYDSKDILHNLRQEGLL